MSECRPVEDPAAAYCARHARALDGCIDDLRAKLEQANVSVSSFAASSRMSRLDEESRKILAEKLWDLYDL